MKTIFSILLVLLFKQNGISQDFSNQYKENINVCSKEFEVIAFVRKKNFILSIGIVDSTTHPKTYRGNATKKKEYNLGKELG